MTPDIARRLRAGEEVSPEEIAAAQAQAAAGSIGGSGDAGEAEGAPEGVGGKLDTRGREDATDKENEWLPEELRRESKGETRARKGKKRR